MPYYKNKEDFVQPITISGKRYIVKPGEVIFSERDLDTKIYSFLEKTTEKTQTKLIALKSNSQQPNKEIETLKNIFNNSIKDITDKLEKTVTREQLIGAINEVLKETPKIEQEELESLAADVIKLKETLEHISDDSIIVQLTNSVDDIKNNQEIIFKRLDILKQVLQNIESVIYESEEYVITDDEKGDENATV